MTAHGVKKLLGMSAIVALFLSAALLALPPTAQAQQTQQASQSSEDTDSALQSLQNMSPEARKQMLDEALRNLQNMSPEQRRQLIATAKAEVQDMPGGSLDGRDNQLDSARSAQLQSARSAQWDKLLTPAQKKAFTDELGGDVGGNPGAGAAKPSKTAAPEDDSVAVLLRQIQTLPPAQQQQLRKALDRAAPAASDPCAEYQTANPAFYANCEARMNKPGRQPPADENR